MAQIPAEMAFTCDICNKARYEDTNEWLAAYVESPGIITIKPFDGAVTWASHLCGEKCLQTWLSARLAEMRAAK